MSTYISPKWLKDPANWTKKGLPRKQADRQRSRRAPPNKGETPQKIMDLLVGSLLGDCSGELQAPFKSPSFAFKQSIIHVTWLFYLYFVMLYWNYANLSIPMMYWTGDGKGGRHAYFRFRTLANSTLLSLYQAFYVDGVKVVPYNIIELMNARVLATWIADDGGWAGSGILLHCNSFTHADVLRLIECLHSVFGIVATSRARYGRTIIYIPAQYVPLVRTLVLPHLHTLFRYKVGVGVIRVVRNT